MDGLLDHEFFEFSSDESDAHLLTEEDRTADASRDSLESASAALRISRRTLEEDEEATGAAGTAGLPAEGTYSTEEEMQLEIEHHRILVESLIRQL